MSMFNQFPSDFHLRKLENRDSREVSNLQHPRGVVMERGRCQTNMESTNQENTTWKVCARSATEDLLSESTKHTWKIPNFSLIFDKKKSGYMVPIRAGLYPGVVDIAEADEKYCCTKYRLTTLLALCHTHNDDMQFNLIVIHKRSLSICMRFKFAILKPGTTDKYTMVRTHDILCQPGVNQAKVLFYRRWELLDPCNDLLDNDMLTITFWADGKLLENTLTPQLAVGQENVINDLSSLLDNGKFSDVTICSSDGVEMKAHKLILASRSTYFDTMFSHENTNEAKLKRVDMKDFDASVVREMLRFLYIGEVHNVEEVAIELIALADKYGMSELHRLCELIIDSRITIDNAFEVLLTAKFYNAVELARKARKFIIRNGKAVMSRNKTKLQSLFKNFESDELGELISEMILANSRSIKLVRKMTDFPLLSKRRREDSDDCS